MNIIKRILGFEQRGTGCVVIGREANIYHAVEGIIDINCDQAVDVSYKWIDNTFHKFVDRQDNYIMIPDYPRPIFFHNVGDIFGCNLEPGFGSEYNERIHRINFGRQVLEAQEDLSPGEPINWVKLLIIGGVIILVIYLLQTGYLQSIVQDIIPGKVQ